MASGGRELRAAQLGQSGGQHNTDTWAITNKTRQSGRHKPKTSGLCVFVWLHVYV